MSEFYKSFPVEEEISDKCIITLNFDLNTKIVEKNQKENNETENYRIAYKNIGDFLNARGFHHGKQESTYTSDEEITYQRAMMLVAELKNNYPCLDNAFRKYHLMSVDENSYEMTELVKNENIKIFDPERKAELKDKYGIEIDDTIRKGRVIRFDFISAELDKIKASGKAYTDAKVFFNEANYVKQERSVYEIPEDISTTHAIKDIFKFFKEHPEYKKALKSIQVCQIENNEFYDVTEIANSGEYTKSKDPVSNNKESEIGDNKEFGTEDAHKPLTLAEAKRIREEKELQEWKEKNHKTVNNDNQKYKSDDIEL